MKRAGGGAVKAMLVTLLGIGLLWHGTDGFASFTAEAARRAEIIRAPRPLPHAVLEDQDGRVFSLQDYRGRLLAVEFIYTRCMTICRSLGAAFRQVRDAVPQGMLGSRFALVSISFDTARDDPAHLKAYGEAFGADGRHWRIARVRNAADLQPLLDAFGIVVIPDRFGGFEHNAALHLLDRDSRLSLIGDVGEPALFAQTVAQWR